MNEYRTPQAFKAALETRQRKRAADAGMPFDRVAQVDLYFRFLDRVLQDLDSAVVVKGGVALEMRLRRARTTGDIDLRALGNPARILERMRQAGRRDHGDYLTFEVNERTGAAEIQGDGVVYEGRRFRVASRFAGKPYRQSFGLDVAFGDPPARRRRQHELGQRVQSAVGRRSGEDRGVHELTRSRRNCACSGVPYQVRVPSTDIWWRLFAIKRLPQRRMWSEWYMVWRQRPLSNPSPRAQ